MNSSLILRAFLCSILLSHLSLAQKATIFRCSLNDKNYAFKMTKAELDQLPEWDIKSDKPLPFSANKAYAVAKTRVDKIKNEEGFRWELKQIALFAIGGERKRWTWKVTFEQVIIEGSLNGTSPPDMTLLVSTKGQLIEPVITDKKR